MLIYKATEHTKRLPLLYNKGLIFLLSGSKEIYTGNEVFEHDRNSVLVVTAHCPLECATKASHDSPLHRNLGKIEMDTLYGLISKISTGDQNGVDKQLVSKIDLDENLDDALRAIGEDSTFTQGL